MGPWDGVSRPDSRWNSQRCFASASMFSQKPDSDGFPNLVCSALPMTCAMLSFWLKVTLCHCTEFMPSKKTSCNQLMGMDSRSFSQS